MKTLEFPDLRQTYNFDCGAIALQSVLAYYGVDVREDSIISIAKTNKRNGTSIKNILSTLDDYEFKYDSREMNIDDLRLFIDSKVPVIIPLQAWTNNKCVCWEKDWEDGHYVVLIGYDSEKLYFEDPSSLGRVYLSSKEFEKRWHDMDSKRNKYVKWGIAVYGNPRYSTKLIQHLD